MKNIRYALLPTLLVSGVLNAQTFTVKSADVGGQATDQQVANTFGCTGKNLSPALSWESAPAGTKSFAITLYDPDAPTGSGFWHWVAFDIPAGTRSLPTGAGDPTKGLLPAGSVMSTTDFGAPGYGGPCPPPGDGDHRYVLTVHALKVDKLGLDAKATPAIVGFNIHMNELAKTSLIFYYRR